MRDYQHFARGNLAAEILLLLAVTFITACGTEAAQAPPTVTETLTVTAAASPTKTPKPATSTPTSTTRPSTPAHRLPEQTPTLTATPLAARVSLTRPGSSPTARPTRQAGTPVAGGSSRIAGLKVSETTITLPTYPFEDYLIEQIDPVYNIPVFYFNRLEFEADAPTPTPVDYKAVVLENSYLRLTFLPRWGGRLYSAVIKATDQEIFYHNPVIKPSRYGVLEPYEANWWLATGGMEWAYPTQEHGYRWGVPWEYKVSQSATETTITLSDTAPDRVGAEVKVTLPADSAVFTVAPKLINRTSRTVPVQFWLNAALTLTSGSMSPETQFSVPANHITIHSRGEENWTVPEAHTEASWPVVAGTDLRDYDQWANYLGFFIPDMDAPFMGAYNSKTNLGVARLIDPGTVPGSKLFAFGRTFSDRSYTDDDSQYFEIWGGANLGFWPEDDLPVESGATLEWQEQWWPLAGLGGLTWANQDVAIYIDRAENSYELTALVARPRPLTLTVLADETPLLTETVSANPAEPLHWNFETTAAPIRIQITDDNGLILLDYEVDSPA
jgi:hypothetical protein